MTQIQLLRFCRACINDGRPAAISLGRVAFARYWDTRFRTEMARQMQLRKHSLELLA